jgi:hypothetical protein
MNSSAVTQLEKDLKNLKNISYESIDKLMRKIMKTYNLTAKELHNDFVKKHNKTPDDWIKKMEVSTKKGHKNFKDVVEAKKGLWDNIHARRKKGLSPKKPGEEGYPKTLDIEEGLKQARKNVGASKCWAGKVAKGTKIKNGKEVPNCVPVEEQNEMIRYCPKCKKDETQSECRYGPKFWAMYSTPSMLTTNQMKYDIAQVHPANEEKQPDHEHSMARSELSTIVSAAKRLRKKLKGEGNIEAWVQSKITKAADYIDAAADYLDSGEHDVHGSMDEKSEIKTFSSFMQEAVDKSKMKCNSPKSSPVGDSLTGKSHVVKACEGDKEKIIRFGQKGVKGSPKKEGESEAYANRRKRFQTRHAKNIAKGKMSAAYWANKVKW